MVGSMATRRRRPRGHVEERPNGTFRAIVYAGTDPLTGKARRLKETAPDWNAAQEALTRLQRQVDERRHPRTGITVHEVLEQWREVTQHEDSTRDRYDQLIRLYIEPTFGAMAAGKVDAEMLERFYGRLLACRELCDGRRRAGHQCAPLAANTIRKIHFIVRAAFERAVRWHYLGVNEAELAEPPAFQRSDPDPPSPAEAAAVLNEASRDASWCLLLWVTMVTGSRRGEICALRWTDHDLDARLASIERSYSGSQEKRTKTRQKRRIALDTYTVALLRAQREEFRNNCQALGVPFRETAFVFSNEPAGEHPLQPHSVSQRYRRLAQRLNLRSTRLHALRHYSATELIAAGIDLRTVAGRLGHGSGGATTLRTYAAWVDEADHRAADAIANIVPRPDPTKRQPRSPYEKIAADLRRAIAAGELQPGDQLPTVLELADTYQVSASTAHRAIDLLRSEGTLSVSRGHRARVLPPDANQASRRTSTLRIGPDPTARCTISLIDGARRAGPRSGLGDRHLREGKLTTF
jgi:integrase